MRESQQECDSVHEARSEGLPRNGPPRAHNKYPTTNRNHSGATTLRHGHSLWTQYFFAQWTRLRAAPTAFARPLCLKQHQLVSPEGHCMLDPWSVLLRARHNGVNGDDGAESSKMRFVFDECVGLSHVSGGHQCACVELSPSNARAPSSREVHRGSNEESRSPQWAMRDSVLCEEAPGGIRTSHHRGRGRCCHTDTR